MSEIPYIDVLEAIIPSNSGTGEDVLAYNGLVDAVEKYRPTNVQRSEAVWEAETGSLDELSYAKQLASEYLLRTSEKVVYSNVASHDIWADRFTIAATEMYGEPDKVEAARLVGEEFTFISEIQGRGAISQQHVQLLLDVYRPILESSSNITRVEAAESDISLQKAAIYEYGKAIRDQYQPLFDLADEAKKLEFTPQDLQELFTKALDWLKTNDDQDWGEWKASFSDSTQLNVEPIDRAIWIGSRRETASLTDTRGLIAHELLVHTLRAKNGYKTVDKKLAIGLPGYLDSEEGLGILAEEAINDVLPDKAYDRYIDIALALGTIDGAQHSRQQLFQISYARQLIRAQFRGDSKESLETLAPRVWGHVDRIYRGGLGGNQGTRQAIFTKDIVYYIGYKQMAEYITDQLSQGKTAKGVFAYLSQAKFDPTNQQHINHLEEISNK